MKFVIQLFAFAVLFASCEQVSVPQAAQIYNDVLTPPGMGAKYIGERAKYWDQDTITVSNIIDKKTNRDLIPKMMDMVKQFNDSLALTFVITEDNNCSADIRISYDPDLCSCSYVGTDALKIHDCDWTINIAWTEGDRHTPDGYRIEDHELRHSLGVIHEQFVALEGFSYDTSAVYDEFINRQGQDSTYVKIYMRQFSDANKYDFTPLDKESNMLYWTKCTLLKHKHDGCDKFNKRPSRTDWLKLMSVYGRADGKQVIIDNSGGDKAIKDEVDALAKQYPFVKQFQVEKYVDVYDRGHYIFFHVDEGKLYLYVRGNDPEVWCRSSCAAHYRLKNGTRYTKGADIEPNLEVCYFGPESKIGSLRTTANGLGLEEK